MLLFGLGGLARSEVASSPHVPARDGSPGCPLFPSLFHFGGRGEQCRCDFGFRLETLERQGEAFADAVVADGKNVGAAEAKHQHHLYRPSTDAPNLGQVLDDGFIGHAADARESGDCAVDGPGGEVTEGEGLIVGEAGGAKLLVGCVEEMLRLRVDAISCNFSEGSKKAGVDCSGGFSVKLLINDGLQESLKRRLLRGEAKGEWAGLGDEFCQLGV